MFVFVFVIGVESPSELHDLGSFWFVLHFVLCMFGKCFADFLYFLSMCSFCCNCFTEDGFKLYSKSSSIFVVTSHGVKNNWTQ